MNYVNHLLVCVVIISVLLISIVVLVRIILSYQEDIKKHTKNLKITSKKTQFDKCRYCGEVRPVESMIVDHQAEDVAGLTKYCCLFCHMDDKAYEIKQEMKKLIKAL